MSENPIRVTIRDGALRLLSIARRIDATTGWVRFPYYHHVFDLERSGFARQLDYMREFGDFVSIGEAVELLTTGNVSRGRYFSIGFDDGFKSCATNAVPILAERGIPATFYIVTDRVGQALEPGDPVAEEVFGAAPGMALEFMSWDDCRTLVGAGMAVGSHTCSHARLASLGVEEVEQELRISKMAIERETGKPCHHFCAPYGIAGQDFDPARDVRLARAAGYASFATGTRGANRANSDLPALRRDHMIASWGNHQLRYFLSSS